MVRSSERRYLLAAAGWAGAVWASLLVPGGAMPGVEPAWLPGWIASWADVWLHGLLMLPLGFLLTRAWVLMRFREGRVLATLSLFGVATETSQLLVPGRSAEMKDLAADLLGGTLGILIARRSLLSSARFGEETKDLEAPSTCSDETSP